VPGVDDEEVRRIGQRDDDDLADVAAKQVRRARPALAVEDPQPQLLVEVLLGAASELRVAAPAGT
jgi:hypothetical protein